MADFNISYEITKVHEGGFVNDPRDPGGYTYKGITKPNYPNWPGWARVAQWVATSGGQAKARGKIFPDAALNAQVKEFYRNEFWNRYGLWAISDQSLANVVYDFRVNSGGAGKVINKALGVAGSEITQATISALNATPNALDIINDARYRYVVSLKDTKGRPLVDSFPGLIKRVDSFRVAGNYALANGAQKKNETGKPGSSFGGLLVGFRRFVLGF